MLETFPLFVAFITNLRYPSLLMSSHHLSELSQGKFEVAKNISEMFIFILITLTFCYFVILDYVVSEIWKCLQTCNTIWWRISCSMAGYQPKLLRFTFCRKLKGIINTLLCYQCYHIQGISRRRFGVIWLISKSFLSVLKDVFSLLLSVLSDFR